MVDEPTTARDERERSQERLEARLNHLEQEILRENRWWRGGVDRRARPDSSGDFPGPRSRSLKPDVHSRRGWTGMGLCAVSSTAIHGLGWTMRSSARNSLGPMG